MQAPAYHTPGHQPPHLGCLSMGGSLLEEIQKYHRYMSPTPTDLHGAVLGRLPEGVRPRLQQLEQLLLDDIGRLHHQLPHLLHEAQLADLPNESAELQSGSAWDGTVAGVGISVRNRLSMDCPSRNRLPVPQ